MSVENAKEDTIGMKQIKCVLNALKDVPNVHRIHVSSVITTTCQLTMDSLANQSLQIVQYQIKFKWLEGFLTME